MMSAQERIRALCALSAVCAWAQVALCYVGGSREPTVKSLECYEALSDLHGERLDLFLKEFVANPDVPLRRALLCWLEPPFAGYPEHLRPLGKRAIDVARQHSDEVIKNWGLSVFYRRHDLPGPPWTA